MAFIGKLENLVKNKFVVNKSCHCTQQMAPAVVACVAFVVQDLFDSRRFIARKLEKIIH